MIRLLGPSVVSDGGTHHVPSSRIRSLLAVLALNASRPVHRSVIYQWLWPSAELPHEPSSAIYNYVCRLRKFLRGFLIDREAPRIHTGSETYRLGIDAVRVDALRFEDLVRDARNLRQRGAASSSLAAFEAAQAQWSGPALVDLVQTQAVVAKAAQLEELRRAATRERIELMIQLGQVNLVTDELALLTGEDSINEGLARQYMIALNRQGRRHDAIRVFWNLREALQRDLGLEPTTSTQQLYAELLSDNHK
jgi:DNA-binding SARP family transcriptional activator